MVFSETSNGNNGLSTLRNKQELVVEPLYKKICASQNIGSFSQIIFLGAKKNIQKNPWNHHLDLECHEHLFREQKTIPYRHLAYMGSLEKKNGRKGCFTFALTKCISSWISTWWFTHKSLWKEWKIFNPENQHVPWKGEIIPNGNFFVSPNHLFLKGSLRQLISCRFPNQKDPSGKNQRFSRRAWAAWLSKIAPFAQSFPIHLAPA